MVRAPLLPQCLAHEESSRPIHPYREMSNDRAARQMSVRAAPDHELFNNSSRLMTIHFAKFLQETDYDDNASRRIICPLLG